MLDEYRLQSRGGVGVTNCKVTERNGLVAGFCAVNDDAEVMVVTNGGMVIRMPVNQISLLGRATQGVRVIQVVDEEVVMSIAPIVKDDDE